MKNILRTLTTSIFVLLSSFFANADIDSTKINHVIPKDTSTFSNTIGINKLPPEWKHDPTNPDQPIPVFPSDPEPEPEKPSEPEIPVKYDVGTPKGAFNVSSSGAAVYEMPFDICPSGTGFDPKLGLVYNSQMNSYGNVGYGVNITGISCITRVGKDMYHDNTFQQVKYEKGDNYLLDGKRLYLKSGTSGMDGSTYTLEGNPYVTIKLHGDDTKGNRFVWFEMTDAEGNVFRYEKKLRCYFGWPLKGDRNIAWYVTSVTNVNGDFISYSYWQDNGCMYPFSIAYGRKSVEYKISFDYSKLTNSQKFVMEGGRDGCFSNRLSSVVITNGTQTFRKYTMQYDTLSDASNRKFDRLKTVNVENGEGKSLAPISFNWNYLKKASVKSSNAKVDPIEEIPNEEYKFFSSSDIDGDGVSDVMRLSLRRVNSNLYPADAVAPIFTFFLDSVNSTPSGQIRYKKRLRYSLTDNPRFHFPLSSYSRTINGNFTCEIDGDNYSDYFVPIYNRTKLEEPDQVAFLIVSGKKIINPTETDGFFCTLYPFNLIAATECPLYNIYDLNHDGKDEVIYVEQKNKDGVFYGNIISDFNLNKLKSSTTNLHFKNSQNQDIRRFFLADCNADGLQDIVLLFDSGYKIYFNNGGDVLSAMFSEDNSRERLDSDVLKNYWRMEQGDFDGDGLVDFVCIPQSEWSIKFIRNNGDGYFTLIGSTNVDFVDKNTDKDDDTFALRVADFDKDGRSDIFVSKQDMEYHGGLFRNYYSYRKTQNRWFLSDGSKPGLWKSIDKTRNADDSKEAYIFTGDFDGDGYLDIANYGSDLTNAADNAFTENTINIYTFSTDVSAGHVRSITNGFGGQASITYLSGTNPKVYSKGNTENTGYPVNTYTLATPLVAKVTQSNGVLDEIYTDYFYGGLKGHVLGRGLLGFSFISTITQRGGLSETRTSEITSWNKKFWIPTETKTTISIGGKTSTQITRNTIFGDASWNGNYFMYPSKTTLIDHDGFKTISSSTYDRQLGVPTMKQTSYDGISDMYIRTNYNGYVTCSGKQLPKNIIVEKKHADDEEVFVVKKDYEYNDKGFVVSATETSSYNGNSNQLTTEYSRDDYGNVLSAKTSGDNVITVEKCYEYDNNGLRLTKKSTLPSSSTIVYSYDIWGNVISESDMSDPSNILTTSHSYDGWGNRILTTSPAGIKTQTKTVWDKNNSNSVFSTTTITDGSAPVTISYDSEGRKIASVTKGKCDIDINTKYSYDPRNGKLLKESIKVGSNTLNSETYYDDWGRVIFHINSDGTGAKYTYNKRDVIEDSSIGKSLKRYDSWGLLHESCDMGGKVTYTYNSMGLPQEVNTNGSTVTMEYDGGGHRTKLIDPDAGTQSYSYAADGRILSQTDGKGITTEFIYDKLGRQIERRCGENIVQTTTYGTSGYDLNKVINEECNGNSETYHYDKYGRLAADIRTCNGDAYTKSYTYDAYGHISSELFGDKVKVDYVHDKYGFLDEMRANDVVCFVQKSYDGIKDITTSGNLKYTETISPNGLIISQKIDNNVSVLDSIGYIYQGKSVNLKSRTRNGLTENFSFDNVDRLVSVESSGNVPNNNYWFNGKVEYKDNGNIAYKTGIGNYDYTSAKPHAVSEIQNIENGLIDTELITSFNDEGKIESISQSVDGIDIRMDFNYGPNREKWETSRFVEKRLNNGSISEQLTKHLYFDDYEKISKNDSVIEQYFLGNGIVLVQDNGDFRLCRTFSDRQGSVLSAHDINSGEEVFRASYDAWGRQKVETNKIDLTHGYCGHDMLPDFELIDMGGRVYEPSTSRFLSCDNYVQSPDKSQNFNRYSYCLNNPLRYTDPTGEAFVIDDLITYALVGAATSALQAHASGGNPWKAAGLSLLSSAATFGVGQVFGSTGTIWNEAARAGAHGLTTGLISSLGGGSFRSGLLSGMTSSAIGSYAQSVNMPTETMIASSALLGGLSSIVFGGDFYDGVLNGLQIGTLNHAMHDSDVIKYSHDAQGNIVGNVSEVEIIGYYAKRQKNILQGSSYLLTSSSEMERNIRRGTNGKLYYRNYKTGKICYGGRTSFGSFKTYPVKGIPNASSLGVGIDVLLQVPEVMCAYNTYGPNSREFNRALYVASGSIAGGQIGSRVCGRVGYYFGGFAAGLVSDGVLIGIGSVAGGIAGNIGGSYLGSMIGGYSMGFLFDLNN